ncbi:MAG: EAL domain-containing protein [Gammaproteobacteria bacterium]
MSVTSHASPVDISNCEYEPIHLPGSIQPHGILFALSTPELAIRQASENVERFFGRPAAAMLGKPFAEIVGDDLAGRLRGALQQHNLYTLNPSPVRLAHDGDGQWFSAMFHRHQGQLIAELEPMCDDAAGIRLQGELPFRFMHDAHDALDLCHIAAREVQRRLGYDRVMVYRFDQDWHGEVIVEESSRHGERDSYLGLHFPASDIPAQARALYIKNRLRVIPDVNYSPCPLVPQLNPSTNLPLDLGCALLRSVSPVHIEYLRNMEVGATLTISLLCNERLWGLIACHHYSPRYVAYPERALCEILGEVVSYQIAVLEGRERARATQCRQELVNNIANHLLADDDLGLALTKLHPNILGALECDGAVVRMDGSTAYAGELPCEEDVELLIAVAVEHAGDGLLETAYLAGLDDRLRRLAPQASGLLYLPLTAQGNFILALRKEITESRAWAGDPHKPLIVSGSDEQLHPRKSFQEWLEIITAHSHRWEALDIQTAIALKGMILERHAALARKATVERIRHLAHHDALTNLPNRVLLQNRFTQVVAQAERYSKDVAMMFLDLDRFKNINDTYGHHVGDKLLQLVAKRLTGCVRGIDTVSRQGGDEFVIMLPDTDRVAAAQAAEKLLGAIAKPYLIEGHELNVTPSIGISLYPEHGDAIEMVLRHADAALYHAKQAGRNNCQFFKQGMLGHVQHRVSESSALRHGHDHDQFVLHYQPQVNLQDGSVVGVEALLRWQHPEQGLLAPEDFMALAEESGLIVPIGAWAISEACRQIKAWQLIGLGDISIAVNISGAQFRQPGLPEFIGRTLDQYTLAAHCLQIEMTEATMMQCSEQTLSTLQALKEIGVQLAVDDFGTGYSSLSYLKRCSIDKLKIDGTFVRGILHSHDNAAIIRAIIVMAKSLQLGVAAESVETEEQAMFLQSLSCNEVQGNYICEARSAHEFEHFLRRGTGKVPPYMTSAKHNPKT